MGELQEVRALLSGQRSGTLATIGAAPGPTSTSASAGAAGHPFGSLVAYALDGDGSPLLCLSDLAEHSRNLAADPRASLLVAEPGPDPLAAPRVTLVGRVWVLHGDERTRGLAAYRRTFPDAGYVDFADFQLYRLEVRTLRHVAGFGRMAWLDPEEREPDQKPSLRS
ncbi:CREG family protein [Pseudonocardia kujensis]|uniref:HugZ family pyridoxamine 5'-phosphate oxidase n=1 Tax=Pseudonocardia kujensis TaxID=1128675 RepID=UPI001E2C8D3B|nr:CREG family protein [Pseudonocardia kujensis]MCE0768135.1 CREG family protein [Pseudonocardia kujensis]